jgi:hypothetical protein
LDLSLIGKLGPDLRGFGGAGEGVHACSADSMLPSPPAAAAAEE